MKKICPKCKTEAESEFCPECGTLLVEKVEEKPAKKVCPKCKTETNSNFCPKCGTKLNDAKNDSIVLSDGNNEDKENAKNKEKSKKKLIFIIGGVVILLLIIGIIGCSSNDITTSDTSTDTETYEDYDYDDTETEEEVPVSKFTKKEDYKDIAYDKLARTPDEYEGKKVKISGQVIQVVNGDDEVDLRIGTSSDGYDDVVYVYYSPDLVDERILEDDWVTVYGTSENLYTYESTMGGEITIPLVSVEKIERQ